MLKFLSPLIFRVNSFFAVLNFLLYKISPILVPFLSGHIFRGVWRSIYVPSLAILLLRNATNLLPGCLILEVIELTVTLLSPGPAHNKDPPTSSSISFPHAFLGHF